MMINKFVEKRILSFATSNNSVFRCKVDYLEELILIYFKFSIYPTLHFVVLCGYFTRVPARHQSWKSCCRARNLLYVLGAVKWTKFDIPVGFEMYRKKKKKHFVEENKF